MRDDLFQDKITKSFEFDENVAQVFDDMLARSIPFYKQTLALCVSLCEQNTKENDVVYDIGCSTGNLLIELSSRISKPLSCIGIDNAEPMLTQAKQKALAYNYNIDFRQEDAMSANLDNTKCVFLNYTLQFIRPMQREELVRKIYEGLEKDGILILSEKLICEDKELNEQLLQEYLAFKQGNGYNQTQIMQKRQALENVLIPYTMKENIQMLENAGFSYVDVVFRWANFATFFARK